MKRLLLFFLLPAAALVAQPSPLQLTPCTPKNVAGLCGTYSVPEDRAQPHGKHIALRVFVLPGPDLAKAKMATPMFLIEGGPGMSTYEHLTTGDLTDVYRQVSRDSDIVAVEERGVGGPDALICPGNSGPRTLKDDFLSYGDVARACLSWAKSHAELDQYHSLNAIVDLDAVRAAMGLDKIDLWALSHGTREALLYAEHYPQHTRAVVLEAPFGTDSHLPSGWAEREDEVLRGTFADCAADKDCSSQYPRLKEDYEQVLAAFARGPVEVKITDPHTKQPTTIAFSKGQFAETIRNLLYMVPTSNRIPALLHAAAAGDWVKLVLFSSEHRMDDTGFPFAMWMSYVCSEDLPYVNVAHEHERASNTLLGDYRVQQQKAACAVWPAAHLPRGWDRPVKSDVPMLLMVGALDVISSPVRAREIAAPFPNSKVVEVAHGGHLLVGQPGEDECVLRIEGDFLEKGSPDAVDVGCAAKLPRGPWN
jgi:pimeloyl-ACP methyl ester carboxylesterase